MEKTTTCLEDLPNEIFQEIWEYLDGCEAYDIFLNLNVRFQYLLQHSPIPLKLHFPFMREDVLQYRIREIIKPNLHRIISLHLTDSTIIDRFLTLFSIDSRFIKLEYIVLNGISSHTFVSLLEKLSFLPRLFCLSANVIEKDQTDRHQISQLVSCIPFLKYTNLSYESPPTTSQHDESYWHQDLLRIHLSVEKYGRGLILRRRFDNEQPWEKLYIDDRYDSDIHTKLTVYRLDSKSFELFLPHVSDRLRYYLDIKHLRIISRDYSYLNANRWKRIIHFMPSLVQFHVDMTFSKNKNAVDCSFIEGFQSPFWIEQGWIINHRHRRSSCGPSVIFTCIKLNIPR